MKIYGLTGGIGAGKSEVGRRFATRKIPVLDADSVAHEMLEPDGAAVDGVLEAFGDEILTCDRIDREKLGAIVFCDAKALNTLNGLVHPAVRTTIAQRCADLMQAGHDAVIIEAALYGEDGRLGPEMSGLILVTCPQEERIRRLVEYRGMSEEEAMRRIEAQSPPEKKRAIATWIIDNSGTLEEMEQQIDAIVKEL